MLLAWRSELSVACDIQAALGQVTFAPGYHPEVLGEICRPVGGLLTSTVRNLFLLPAVFLRYGRGD